MARLAPIQDASNHESQEAKTAGDKAFPSHSGADSRDPDSRAADLCVWMQRQLLVGASVADLKPYFQKMPNPWREAAGRALAVLDAGADRADFLRELRRATAATPSLIEALEAAERRERAVDDYVLAGLCWREGRTDNDVGGSMKGTEEEPKRLPDGGRWPRTESGNAELFAHLFADRVRYDHARKQWLVWCDHWWAPDVDGEVRRLAIQATRERRRRSADIQDQSESKEEAKFALQSESVYRIEAALRLATSLRPIADRGEDWDRDPYLLGVGNGVVDLRTGQLRPGGPEDRISKHTTVQFDPKAECPRWLRVLGEIFEENPELVLWIQMAAGYSLTGDTSEQVLFMLYGTGANGKTTFLNVIRTVAGDYGYNMPFSTLERRAQTQIGNDVAALAGRRFVTASETNENERLNEARIKALTGGDAITARFLYSEQFTFRPVGKFWLAVNHKPAVGDDSVGFWRRVRLIPFLHQFKDEHADRHLEHKLLDEMPGILNWMVQGCLRWQKRGQLGMPPAVKEATESYREEMDHVSDFIDECCVLREDGETPAASLWQTYTNWCRESRLRALSRNELADRLKARGCDNTKRGAGGRKVWTGIRLLSDAIAEAAQ